MRVIYDLWYRFGRPPWVGGARSDLVELVESGRLPPGRALDLGCGIGSNVIYLAEHGFDATGVDFARSAIDRARRTARQAGVEATFIAADLRKLEEVTELRGTFDLLVDYGTLDDLSNAAREEYLRGVLPLTRPGTRFLLYCFEWAPLWWERLLAWLLPSGDVCMLPGEVERRFGPHFTIERIAGEWERDGWPRGYSVYLMERRPPLG